MKGILLAAGDCPRLRPLTATIPKPMIEVAGRPVLEHNVRLFARHDIRDLIINLHSYPVKVMDHFGDGDRFGVSIRYSYEAELLGTAGALKRVEDLLTEAFIVMYADNLTRCDLTRLVGRHREGKGVVTLAVVPAEPGAKGVVTIDREDRIRQIAAGADAGRSWVSPNGERTQWLNGEIAVMEPSVLAFISDKRSSDLKRDVFPALLAADRPMVAYRMEEGFWRIDSPAEYARVKELIESGMIVLP